MIHWLFTIITLILSGFGLYAFIHIMMKRGGINLMTHDEFKDMPEEIKKLYKNTILDIIVPSYSGLVTKVWDEVRKEIDYKSIQTPAIESAKLVASMIDEIPVSDISNEIVAGYKNKEGFSMQNNPLSTRLTEIVKKAF